MAILYINTGIINTPIEDINLESITNSLLITVLVNCEALKPAVGEEKYYLLSKENQPIYEENKTLQVLGFKDGDIISIVQMVGREEQLKKNMATMQVRLAWSGEEITIAEFNINEITINDIITELIDGDVLKPNENGQYYSALSKGNQPVYEKNKTLNDLGFKDGDTITILIRTMG